MTPENFAWGAFCRYKGSRPMFCLKRLLGAAQVAAGVFISVYAVITDQPEHHTAGQVLATTGTALFGVAQLDQLKVSRKEGKDELEG